MESNRGASCLTTWTNRLERRRGPKWNRTKVLHTSPPRSNRLQHHSISTSTHLLLLLLPPIPNYIPTLYPMLYYTTEPCPPTHHTFLKTERRGPKRNRTKVLHTSPPRSNRLQHHSISTSTHPLLLLPPTPNYIPTQYLTLYYTAENDSCVKMGSDESLTAQVKPTPAPFHYRLHSPAPPSSSSSSADSPRCWSQWARICSKSRRVLASRRPRLSSGLECTMLCRAAEALALAAALPRVLPRRPESLSLPCRSWISRGRQPGGGGWGWGGGGE